MTQTFTLPDLGEGIHEAEIREILVSTGDQVEADQPILVVETDKASVEVPSPIEGTVASIQIEVGERVEVGDTLLKFKSEDGEQIESKQQEKDDKDKDQVKAKDQSSALEDAQEEVQEDQNQPETRGRQQPSQPVPASPATRRLARELEVDIVQVSGSGPGGRVTRQDVEDFAEGGAKPVEQPDQAEETEEAAAPKSKQEMGRIRKPDLSPATIQIPELPNFERWGAIERQPLRSIRRTIARRMALSWSQVPHVTHRDVADVTALEYLRLEHKNDIEERGGSLTLTLFVIKAAAAVLKEFPRFNASLDAQAEELILKQYYHFGIAVDTEQGLIVPVIRDVDQKSIADLAVELDDLAVRTRAGEASLDELQGSSFTITNVGHLGGTDFTPIINYPDVAILGMTQARWQPQVITPPKGEQAPVIEARFMLPLIIGFDHRVVDGADAARFLSIVIEALENPDKLILEI